jgi:hypothetical protein
MLKHRGFPSRLPGTDHQFTIRRANKAGATPLVARKRHADRRPADRAADSAFLSALMDHFGDAPFERGNLDAGRLSWLLGREVVPADPAFDPEDYAARLRVDMAAARRSFPHLFDSADAGDAGNRRESEGSAAPEADEPATAGSSGREGRSRPQGGRPERSGNGPSGEAGAGPGEDPCA